MKDISLSICIPTYNRADILVKSIFKILQCDKENIEIVVLDNGSTDNTLELLSQIDDSRLSIYKNGENNGFLYNILNVLDKAKGEFLIFSTDKDEINFKEIKKFIDFLSLHNNIAGGYCDHTSGKVGFEIFRSGINAISKIAYQSHHPTGYFFKNNLLKQLDITKRFSDPDVVDMFPFEFIFAELCSLGDGAIYSSQIISTESLDNAAKQKSYGTKKNTKEIFFFPSSRLKLTINFIRHVNSLSLKKNEKFNLISGIFLRGLKLSTFEYRRIMKNPDLCSHYYIQTKTVGRFELIKIALSFYIGFSSNLFKIMPDYKSSHLIFNAELFSAFLRKKFPKFLRGMV